MIKTYFINNDLGYITIPESLSSDGKVIIGHLRQSATLKLDEQLVVIKAFLGDTEEESEIKARNWFSSKKLDINDINNWHYRDMSNHAMIFKTYEL